MLHPVSFEEKLEFHKIRDLIKKNCTGNLGVGRVDDISFSTEYDEIITRLKQTAEFKKILDSGDNFPSMEYMDYAAYLLKASKIDSFLTEEEFHNLKASLSTLKNILGFISKNSGNYPEISLLAVGIYLNPELPEEIDRIIDEHGKVRDNASKELLEIRDSLKKQHFRVRRIMEKMLSDYIAEGYSQDDSNVTIRNGRLVLPVRAEFKRNTGGFIHDESASGQTAYIEPANVLEINNDIMDLEYREKRELLKILARLTDIVRPEITNLSKGLDFLGTVDFIRAKAKVAIMLEASLPEIVKKPAFKWTGARHPLLFLSHRAIGKAVVPLDLELTSGNRILIISGPNAGGKSVCLKTIGLNQYMLQCGLLVPMSEGSVMGIFNSILLDIGDEQSIENDLSTYSSHLISMKAFVAYAGKKTLFLIDEFGSGTEPQFGGAIAEAILDHLVENKAYGIITTHYSNLKKYANEHPGVLNGAMRFDLEKLEPLFMLDIGHPGSSFALEIAAKIGLPEKIISTAGKKVGFEQVNYEKLLVRLENEKRHLEEKNLLAQKKEKELKKLSAEYEELKIFLENRKKNIIDEARVQALDILNEANRTVENSIREIRESQADKNISKTAREHLEKTKKKLAGSGQKKKTELPAVKAHVETLSVGNMASIKGQDSIGQIISLKGKEAELIVGQVKIKIPVNKLQPVSGKTVQIQSGLKKFTRPGGFDVTEKMQQFRDTLDIRGLRANDAINKMDQYLDQALYLNKKEVRILHGKGNGILRNLVRVQLLRYNFIQEAHDEHVESGGAGITVVTLK